MKRIRVIPVLLVDRNGGLVKTVGFGKRTYIGDPINAVRIFNDKEVDELVVLDIDASADGRPPNVKAIEEIVSEAFMPISYGGGISSLAQMRSLHRVGVEKVVLRTAALRTPELVSAAAAELGRQSVVGCLDIHKGWLGKNLLTANGKQGSRFNPLEQAKQLVQNGCGELIVQSVDRDGTYGGYDVTTLKEITSGVTVPVVGCGGASSVDDFRAAVELGGCHAVAAGSMFVYQAKGRGVLISYPSAETLERDLYRKIST